MITRYERPKTIEEARQLLSEKANHPVVLAGGIYPDELAEENLTAIDLQTLGFDQVRQDVDSTKVEGMVTMQKLADHLPGIAAIEKAVMIEGGRNVRNSRTLHQHLFFCNGRSPLASILLAMDATLEFFPEQQTLSLISFFAQRKHLQDHFVKTIIIEGHPAVAFECIARSPLDLPLLIISIALWPDGRIRAAIGGFGKTPQEVYAGKDSQELLRSVKKITQDATDQWASAEYRQETAEILARRCLKQLGLAMGEV